MTNQIPIPPPVPPLPPLGNISLVNWTDPRIASLVQVVPCIPLHTLLKTAKIKHVNLFVLDVEGTSLLPLFTTVNRLHIPPPPPSFLLTHPPLFSLPSSVMMIDD